MLERGKKMFENEEMVEGRIESKERLDGRLLISIGASILVVYFLMYTINSFDFITIIDFSASI